MKYYKKLVGDRIYLSPMCIEDAEKYVEWFCDFKMADGIKKSSSLMTEEAEREWIESSLKENRLNFVIVRLEDDKVIGNCGIMNVNQKDRCGEVDISSNIFVFSFNSINSFIFFLLLFCWNYVVFL